MPNKKVSDVAERFARALDADAFAEASSLLAENCLYRKHNKELRGRELIMGSFIEASEWAHSNIDKVVYEHTLDMRSAEVATIKFVDVFEHSGQQVVHACLMHVETGPDSLIRNLTLEELPGERQRVRAFLEMFGIIR